MKKTVKSVKKADWKITFNGSKEESIKKTREFAGISEPQRQAVIEALGSIDGPFVSGTISGHKDGSGFLSVSMVGRTVRGV